MMKQRNTGRKKLVFVVDNEQTIARTLALILERAGCHAAFFYSAEEAMEAAALQLPDLVVSDVIMDGINGIELKRRMQAYLPGLPFILLSGQARTSELIQQARTAGHDIDVYEKPMHPEALILKVNRLLTSV